MNCCRNFSIIGCVRQANNAVKKSTEFRFFQWLIGQLGVSEDQSGLDIVDGAKAEAIHKCLCVLLEYDVVEVSQCTVLHVATMNSPIAFL